MPSAKRGLVKRLGADHEDPDSLANRFRRARFAKFESLLDTKTAPVKLLDVGGTASFWRAAGDGTLISSGRVVLTLINKDADPEPLPDATAVDGDATNMTMFADDEFDVVFSNSVIEHVGDRAAQARMAQEVMRVGKSWFVQTPNYWFPLEPHFHVPGFQWLPDAARAQFIQRFDTGWYGRREDPDAARALAEQIKLISPKQLQSYFPTSELWREKLGPLTKSMAAYGGW